MAFFAAAAPIIGSAIAGLFGRKGAKDQNEAQLASAREQMAFQERMSNTAHQREVADLRAAGLNPILSAHGGASSPGGAQADIVNELEPAVSSAMQARRLAEDVKSLQAQRRLTEATTRKEEWLGDQAQTGASLARRLENENYEIGVNSAHRLRQENEIRRQVLSEAEATQSLDRTKLGDLWDRGKDLDFGQLRRMFQSIFGVGNSARQLLGD